MIYHIASAPDVESARLSGVYETTGLHTEKFIHASKRDQVEGVVQRYYKNTPGLFILEIDPKKLTSELKFEPSTHDELFPHIYGPINWDAVVRIVLLEEFLNDSNYR